MAGRISLSVNRNVSQHSVAICPKCGGQTNVKDSRKKTREGSKFVALWRRRACVKCGHVYTTYEITGASMKALLNLAKKSEQLLQHIEEFKK